jgi:hypothetical protein
MVASVIITLLIALGVFAIIRKAKNKKTMPMDSSIKAKPHKVLKYTLTAIAVFVCAIGFIALMAHSEDMAKTKEPNKIEAYTMAEQFVQKRLKAPSTAKFPYSSEATIDYDSGTKEWTVNSYVDAQNSFGAMMRTNYTVKVKYLGDDKWSLLDINMEQ